MQEIDEKLGAIDLPEELQKAQDATFAANMRRFNLMGNLQHWRTNSRNNSNRGKILVGYSKIMQICGLHDRV